MNEKLGDPDATLIIDDTGFLKQGKNSCGVKRQYSGIADVYFATPVPSGSIPAIVCTPIDNGGRSISIVIGLLPGQTNYQNGFRAYASISVVTGSHNHKSASMGSRNSTGSFNANQYRAIDMGGVGGLFYSFNGTGTSSATDVYTDTATVYNDKVAVSNISFNYIAV